MSATHEVALRIVVVMEDMDGTPEQSEEIAIDQVCAALDGRPCQYGLPIRWDIESSESWEEA